jgi:hypothetical protein
MRKRVSAGGSLPFCMESGSGEVERLVELFGGA